MTAAARPKARERRGRGAAGFFGWLLILLAALALVVWRQTRGVALEREVRELATEREIAEAERVMFVRKIQSLASRARIVRIAGQRLNMRVPADSEIIFLPVARETTSDDGQAGVK